MVEEAKEQDLLSEDHFSTDGTLLVRKRKGKEAWLCFEAYLDGGQPAGKPGYLRRAKDGRRPRAARLEPGTAILPHPGWPV